jgi:hypothetical protein
MLPALSFWEACEEKRKKSAVLTYGAFLTASFPRGRNASLNFCWAVWAMGL